MAEGETKTVMVKLASEPEANVGVAISSDDTGELTVSPESLVFTSDNWNTAKPVVLTGEADSVVDGTQQVMVTFYVSSSGDSAYNAVADVHRSLDVTDVDTASLVFNPASLPASIREDVSRTQTIRLATRPAADVAVAVTSDDSTVLEVTGSPLTFTSTNWETPKEVVFRAVRNRIIDTAPREATATYEVSSSDSNYDTLGPFTQDVQVANVDHPPPFFAFITPFAPLPESGMISVTVKLLLGMETPVSLLVWSSDLDRATLSVPTVTVTVQAPDDERLVTVYGVNDDVDEDTSRFSSGHAIYQLTVSVFGEVSLFTGRRSNATGNILDDDTASLVLNPPTLPNLAEGESVTVDVMLGSQPTLSVNVAVRVSDPSELSASPAILAFTSDNWNMAQPVELSGVADSMVDGTKPVTVTYDFSSTDNIYNSLPNVTQSLDVTDVDEAGLVLAPDTLPSLAEGETTTVMVNLTSIPSAGVNLAVRVSDATELSFSPASLVFTSADWNTPKAVELTGKADNVVDGTKQVVVTYAVSSTGDSDYESVADVTRSLDVTDEDESGLVLVPDTFPNLAEGERVTVDMMLISMPTENVEAIFSLSDITELTISPGAGLLFTPDDWNVAKSVTLEALEDSLVDGTQQVSLTIHFMTGDIVYNSSPAVVKDLDVTDVDVAGFVGLPASLPTISENGGFATVNLRLSTAAEGGVTLSITSLFPAVATLSPTSVSATLDATADIALITITAIDDNSPNSPRDYALQVSVVGGPGSYDGLALTVSGTVSDDDSPNLVLSPLTLSALAEDATSMVMVKLATEPSAIVTVSVSSSDINEASVSPSRLEFTDANWDMEQPVLLAGVGDRRVDGTQEVTVTYDLSSTDGTAYNDVPNVTQDLSVTDVDVAGLELDPDTIASVAEGATATVTVRLTSIPAANVTVSVTVSDATELSFSPASLEFTTANWNVPRPVTLSGVADRLLDGTQAVMVTYDPSSSDSAYNDLSSVTRSLDVTNTDVAQVRFVDVGLPNLTEGDTVTVEVELVTGAETPVSLVVWPTNTARATLSSPTVTVTVQAAGDTRLVTIYGVDNDIVYADGDTTTPALSYVMMLSVLAGPDPFKNLAAVMESGILIDDDTASLVLGASPTSLAEGETATVTVSLESQPTVNVTVSVNVSDTSELSFSPVSLVFTSDDWNAPRDVELMGVDDSLVDGSKQVTVTYDFDSSSLVYGDSLNVTQDLVVTDQDVAGFEGLPAPLPTISENGGFATVNLRLSTAAEGGVTLSITSLFPAVATLSATSVSATLVATADIALITITAIDDNSPNSPRRYALQVSVVGGPVGYAGLALSVSGMVTNDDVPNLVLTPLTLAPLAEGATSTVMVMLATQPGANVNVAVTVSDTTELSFSPASLEFTTANWNMPRPVTLSGVADSLIDGTQAVEVTYDPSSSDSAYNDLSSVTQDLSVTDADAAGLELDPDTIASVAEGATATVTVRLTSIPAANVTVSVTVSDATELSFSPASLEFTTANWNVPRPVTLSGVADRLLDGTQAVMVTYDPSSSDSAYNDLSSVTRSLDVTNTDVAQVRFVDVGLPNLTEGDTVTVEVELVTGAETPVSLVVWPTNTARATLSSPTVTVTVQAAGDTRLVTIYGVDNDIVYADGDTTPALSYVMMLSVLAGPDPFKNLAAVMESGILIDDDTASLVLDASPTSLAEGETATVTVSLESQPTVNVTVSVTVSDTSELSFSPVSLVFTSDNWNAPRDVELMGVDDSLVDGSKQVTVTYDFDSSSLVYGDSLNVTQDLVVTDQDVAGFEGLPAPLPTISENGGFATVNLRLSTAAEGGVTLSITSLFPAVATLSATSVSATLVATADIALITITAIDDNSPNSPRRYALQVSVVGGPVGYAGLALSVSGMVTNDDVPNLVLTPLTLAPLAEGATSTVMVMLATQPGANVNVAVTVSDTTELSFSPASLEFTTANWNMPRPVTLSGVADSLIDGTQAVEVTYDPSSSDSAYNDLSSVTQDLSVTDVDAAGLELDPDTIASVAEGATATVTVRLTSIPAANVTVSVTVSDATELSFSPASLEFTTANWNVPRPVTLSGVADRLLDGTQAVEVTYDPSSSDSAYNDLSSVTRSLDVTNTDVAQIRFVGGDIPDLPEGGSVTVEVQLVTGAEEPVLLGVWPRRTARATLSSPTVTVTVQAAGDTRMVTIYGVDNDVDFDDGVTTFPSRSYVMTLAVLAGPGPFVGLSAITKFGTLIDDDTAGLALDPSETSLGNLAEGETATVMVSLESQPTVNVNVSVSVSDTTELEVSTANLEFTSTDWNTLQPVMLTGKSDSTVDGSKPVTVTYVFVTNDFAYENLSDVTQDLVVTDQDVAGLVLAPDTIPPVAEGATETVMVKLASIPAADVNVAFSVSDATELSFSPASLVFTADNWNVALPVTLTGQEDNEVDGTQAVVVTYAVSSTGDSVYEAVADVNRSLDVTDVDVADLVLDPDTGTTVSEGATAMVMVELASRPAAVVTVAVSSSETGEATVSPSRLEFTAANWNVPRPVALSGVGDSLVDGTQAVMVTYAVSSDDIGYGPTLNKTQSLVVTDSDAGGLALEPAALPSINENGGTAMVVLRLSVAAESGVVLSFTSLIPEVATLTSPSPLRATLTTLDDRATVTLEAIDNVATDGNQEYALLVSVESGPGSYSGLSLSVTGMVTDDDVANLLLAPTTLPNVTEIGETQVSVMLATQPTGDMIVTVAFSVSDTTELSFSPAILTFTATDWNVAKAVVLSGVPDNLVDGTKQVVVTYDVSSTDGSAYDDLDSVTQTLNVTDRNNGSFFFNPVSLPTIDETGGLATVTVKLVTAVETGVTLDFRSNSPEFATLSAESITATLTTTGDEAMVTLFSVPNNVDRAGPQRYGLRLSVANGPPGYAGRQAIITGGVTDDDVAALVLDPSTSTLSDLAEGATRTVMVKLASQPATQNVTMAVTSSDESELTVSTAQLVFTTGNWDTPQPVVLSGVGDSLVDGTQAVMVTYAVSSDDIGYGPTLNKTQSLVVTDSDVGGLALEPAALPTLNEPDGVATLTLRLTKSSSSPVTLAVWSSDPAIATLSSPTLTLTLMSALDRGVFELGALDIAGTGNSSFSLMVSVLNTVGGYANKTLTAGGTVLDDDGAVVRFVPAALPRIDEGGSVTVSVALGATPTAPVTLAVSSRNPLVATLTAAIVNITLDGSRLSAPVIVSGVTNALLADQAYELTVSVVGSGTDYNGQVASARGSVVSDDVVLVADPAELGDIPREGGSVTLTLRLGADPAIEVTVNIGNAAPSGATLLGPSQSQTFMMDDLDDRVTVTLMAVNDVGTYPREFGLLVTVSTGHAPDAGFNTVLTLMGMVHGEPGLLLAPGTLADLAEGTTSQVMVKLAVQPSANVNVNVSSSDQSELTVNPTSLVFSTTDWNTAQPVVLTRVEDDWVDGTKPVTVTYVSSGGDAIYSALPHVTQELDVTDVDVAALVPDPTTLPDINENGETAAVTLRLSVAAETGVVLSFTSPFASAALPTSLRATLRTLDDRATVTLRTVDDISANPNRPYALLVTVVSGPGSYEGLGLSLAGIVLDDDSPNLVLDPPTLPDVAEGATSIVMVNLATMPRANVNVAVSSSSGELSVSPASLEFTTTDWSMPQAIALTGVEDSLVDGRQQVMVTYVISSTGDTDYNDLSDVTQTLNVNDGDTGSFSFGPITQLTTILETGGKATVTVSLGTAVETGVELVITSVSNFATLSSDSITATLTTTSDGATVTLFAVPNNIDTSATQRYGIMVSVVSGPLGYAGLTDEITGVVTDDDVAALVLDPSTQTLPDLAEGATSPVMVKLASEPTATVTVNVSTSDLGEVSVPPAQLVFTADNWNTDQPVVLSGREDNLVDGTQTVMVTYAASSSDNNYGGLAAMTQSLEVTDSDRGGLALEPAATTLPQLSEPDGVVTVSLRLTKTATSPVTLSVWSSNTLVATLSSATMMLTLVNATDLGAVALGAVDNLGTGNGSYALMVSVVNGVDGYDSVMLSVPGTVIDDDAVGVRFVVPGSPRLMEGGSLTVSLVLGATPTAAVTLEVSSVSPLVATLSPAIVTLTLEGPLASAPVIVSGVTNTLLADQTYTLTVSAASGDTDYDGLFASATGTVASDDNALDAGPAELGEFLRRNGPATVLVTLRLERNPTAPVTVIIDNFNSEYATLLGPSQSQTVALGNTNDSMTLTLVTMDDEGGYPREFGLRVMVTTGNNNDAGFISVLTLRGTMIESRLSSETTTMLQVAVADIASAGLAIDLVSDNINGGPSDGPRAQIGGRSVSGLSATVGVSPSRPPDPWNDSDPWSESDDAQWKDGMGLVPGSGFVLPLSSGAGTGTSTELWGGARYSDLSGEPAIGGVRHSYDGDAVAMQVGLTRRYASGMSAGFSIGQSWVDLEVSAVGSDEVAKAKRRLLSFHPYVSMALFPDTRLLMLAGFGNGTYNTVGSEDRKASMRMAAARVERDWKMEGFDLSGKLGVLSVESELEAIDTAPAQRGGSFQSRAELEFSKSYAPGEGMSLRPYGSLGYLHESGTVDTEGGVEIGAGIRGAWIAGLDAEVSARYQLDGARRSERKLQGHLSIDPGLDKRGLLLDARQEHSLSEEADGSASIESEYTARVGHGWGRTLWRRHGVLGAYLSTVEGSGGGFHGPRLGVSFEAASLELVAEQGIGEGRLHLNYVSNF